MSCAAPCCTWRRNPNSSYAPTYYPTLNKTDDFIVSKIKLRTSIDFKRHHRTATRTKHASNTITSRKQIKKQTMFTPLAAADDTTKLTLEIIEILAASFIYRLGKLSYLGRGGRLALPPRIPGRLSITWRPNSRTGKAILLTSALSLASLA
jgi:hypothetical protein